MSERDEIDSFWDIDKLVPKKKKNTLSSFSTKEKTVTVNISGDDDSDAKNRRLTLNERDEGTSERTYNPDGTLIVSVNVKHIPDKFDFHANFIKAAELYFDFTAPKCDFVQFYSYMPQYTQLTQQQKNYYFYWRSMLRRGVFLKTDYSYFYLHVYEILNLPNLIPPEKGIRLLTDLWKNYRSELPNVDSNMALWVQDYCLVYGLPAPIEEIKDFIFDIMSVTKFKEFYFSGYESFSNEGVRAIIAYLSDYDWRKSKYAGGENREAYERHMLCAMSGFVKEMMDSNAFGMGIGSTSTKVDNAFRWALTTCPIKYRLTVTFRPISEESGIRAIVTSVLKYTENKLRALMGVKSRLAVKNLDARYTRIIDEYFSELFEKVNRERIKASRPEYEKLYEAENEELSMVGADEIERASWITTARLVVDEENEVEIEDEKPRVDAEKIEEAVSSEIFGLGESEIKFLHFVYNCDCISARELCNAIGEIPDSLADRINEAFSENFGDVIIEDTGDGYEVISDYREDVEEWLTKAMK